MVHKINTMSDHTKDDYVMSKTQKIRCACITFWKEPIFPGPDDKVDYLIAGYEIAPTTGKEHWQSYAEFSAGLTMSQIKRKFKDKLIRIAPRFGKQYQAIDYCKKDGKFVEYGQRKEQGKRTDLEQCAMDLVGGNCTLEDVMMENPTLYCKYRNGLKDLAMLGTKETTKKFRKIDTEVYWGASGSGKTRKAVEENPDNYKIVVGSGPLWFDGYNGEKTLILDEFYGGLDYNKFLEILDGFQCRLPVKGGFTYAKWTKVVITSNSPPHDWYPQGLPPALKRRLTKTTQM